MIFFVSSLLLLLSVMKIRETHKEIVRVNDEKYKKK